MKILKELIGNVMGKLKRDAGLCQNPDCQNPLIDSGGLCESCYTKIKEAQKDDGPHYGSVAEPKDME